MTSRNHGHYARSGAVAGAFSALVFTAIHDVMISDIWYSLAMMMAAGAACGLLVGWTYGLTAAKPSPASWIRYNLIYVVTLMLLGAASVIVYEPVTTLAAVIAANAPPNELFGQAMPMTIAFTVLMAAAMSLLYGRTLGHYVAILVTCIVLILLLGLNVSAIGLIEIPSSSFYLIAELFVLIAAIDLVYAAAFIALERKRMRASGPPAAGPVSWRREVAA